MRADRCLDCGYLHARNSAKACSVCGSLYLVTGVSGDLDEMWAAHRSGFPEGTEQSARAWGELVASYLLDTQADRAAWRSFGWLHFVLVPGGRVFQLTPVSHDVCRWG